MLELYFASGNIHKAQEMAKLFPSTINIKVPNTSLEVAEIGTSFLENAYLKAHAYFQELQVPVLADDSGLVVDALPGELGIYSARFGGGNLSQEQQISLLLEKMHHIPVQERSASFVCVLCVMLSSVEAYFFEGTLPGEIAHQAQGKGGFGYDPIFIPKCPDLTNSLTLAQLADWKQIHSHRAIAVNSAAKFLQERVCQLT